MSDFPNLLWAQAASPELAKEVERRWNNHDALVEALERALIYLTHTSCFIERDKGNREPAPCMKCQAEAALAAAKGEL